MRVIISSLVKIWLVAVVVVVAFVLLLLLMMMMMLLFLMLVYPKNIPLKDWSKSDQ